MYTKRTTHSLLGTHTQETLGENVPCKIISRGEKIGKSVNAHK